MVLGRIGAPYGVRGWVHVHSYTTPNEQILDYEEWWLQHGTVRKQGHSIEARRHGKGVVARFEGVESRERADELKGWEIAVERAALEVLPEGEYYWADLIGCEVFNLSGTSLGRVVELMATGANDVLVTRRAGGESLIPFVSPWVIEVRIDEKRISVDWELDF